MIESERQARVKKSTSLHLAMEAAETLRQITEFPDNPESMAYFYDLYQSRFKDGMILPQNGKKLVGTMCLQVPDELIVAAGAVPVRLCSGAYAFDQAGGDFMPAKSCPLVRATMGMLQVNNDTMKDNLSTVVIPTTCDQKRSSAEMLRNMDYPVTILEMPATKESDEARTYWQESVKQFALGIQKTCGRKITAKSLNAAVRSKLEAGKLFRSLQQLRTESNPVILGKDIWLVSNSYFFDDPDQWCQAVKGLIAELESRKFENFSAINRKAPRLLFTGSPPIFPNLKLPILVEQAGGLVVADETCSSQRLLHDAVVFDEKNLYDMVPAIADRYLKPCNCPCLTPNTDRAKKILEMVRSDRVEGVVYQAFSGCMPYEMEQRAIGDMLSREGIPMLFVETDYSPEDQGQLSTRVEAFIESIKVKRRKTQ
jgi:benzoyl-CoA reductase/2-hydroxyglutaryl-CoA dehydratase subunit BcrC/BadD/HgdB